MSFCLDKYLDKSLFPKATPEQQLCRVMCRGQELKEYKRPLFCLENNSKPVFRQTYNELLSQLKVLAGSWYSSAQAQLLLGFEVDPSGCVCSFQRPCSRYCCPSVSFLTRSEPSCVVDIVCIVCTHVLYFHFAALKSVCLHLLNCMSSKFACRKNNSC